MFWLPNNYKIIVMIIFSDQLSQDNWYLRLATKILATYIIKNLSLIFNFLIYSHNFFIPYLFFVC